MNINATLVGQVMFVFVLIVGALSYYLGRRKTQMPVLAGLLGIVLCIVPPFALVYLAILVLKKDVGSTSSSVSGHGSL